MIWVTRVIGIMPSYRGGTQTRDPRLLPQFPVTLDPKSGLNFAAFYQATFSRAHFSIMPANTRCERSHFNRQPP
jgi:hypothetical protein